MSSVQTVFAQPRTNPTTVFTPNTIAYVDSVLGNRYPVPFVVSNGVLDIRIQDNVVADLLTVGTFANLYNQSWQAQVMGGTRLVSSLGENMVAFLKAFIDNEEGDVPTNISIWVAATMTKLSWNYIDNENTWEFDSNAPTQTDLVWGGPDNAYRTTWLFRSPLVVKYYSVSNSEYRYLTFTSALDSI